ncbi:MAG: protoheme IX farnesyltransferase [Candidatus Bathyarchaeota archaeon]|nr:protoheme IX farnesyltransferase [Candidatus Bathyarchaeota archaeon]
MSVLYSYGVLLKPKVTLALLALYVTSFLCSSFFFGGDPFVVETFLVGFFAVAFAVTGSNGLNCYIDRDIDAEMARTSGRPLVLGSISANSALVFSLVMMMIAGVIALWLGTTSVLILIEGAGSYIILYSMVLKRKTIWNVLANAPSVAAPAWFGWYMGGAPLFPIGFLMGSLVAIWGPLHLWSLAYAFKKDYLRVGVPMLSTVLPEDKAIRGMQIALGVMIASSYLLTPWTRRFTYILGVSALNIPLMIIGRNLSGDNSKKAAWWLFKLSAPYIVLLFLVFMVSQII